ncbi:MAG: hypothetical protein IKZ86_11475 [Spirochaetaceae bacterium]|nr:hypothetical protein [Spirochaetaceae bacterium]
MKYFDYSGNLITRICYIFFEPNLKSLVKNPKNIIVCFIKYLIHFFYSLIHIDRKEPVAKQIIFFSTTLNNNRSLEPIWSLLNNDSYSLWLSDNVFSETKISIFSFFHLIDFFKTYNSLNNEDKRVVRYNSYAFMNAYGYYITIGNYLRKNKNTIKLIIMANDHSFTNLCIIENCLKYDIKTLYVQHANITECFPPNRFSYSFLDGIESYNKYLSIEKPIGRVFLSGSSRFDSQITSGKHNDIGIAVNELDDMNQVIALCQLLRKNEQSRIIIRFHPAMSIESNFMNLINNLGIKISDSKQENPYEFLSRLKILIANESGIHLEAALGQVPSVLYNFSTLDYCDNYSFVKKGLVKYCNSYDEVLKECKNPQLISKSKVRDYNAAIGTKYQGNVAAIIAKIINRIVNNENVEEYINFIFNYNKKGYYEYKN